MKKISSLFLLFVIALTSSLAQLKNPIYPAPANPSDLELAVARATNVKCQRQERFTPADNYSAAVNGGAVGQMLNITGATNATPIVVTTRQNHNMVDGQQATDYAIEGNSNANGTYYVDVLTPTTFALYTDAGLTSPRAGNGTYYAGTGQVKTPTTNGESADLFYATGPGTIKNFTIICSWQPLVYACQRVWITIDGVKMEIPLWTGMGVVNGNIGPRAATNSAYDVYGLLWGNADLRTQHMSLSYMSWDTYNNGAAVGVKLRCDLPIPYKTSARISLFNKNPFALDSNGTQCVWSWANYVDGVTAPFRLKSANLPVLATATNSLGTSPVGASSTVDFLNVAGSGWIVGHWWSIQNSTNNNILERNINFYANGESVASYQTSGTEDYFDDQFYSLTGNGYRQNKDAYLSFIRPQGTKGGTQSAATLLYTGYVDLMQRTGSGLRFKNGGILRWDVFPDNPGVGVDISSTVLYYQ